MEYKELYRYELEDKEDLVVKYIMDGKEYCEKEVALSVLLLSEKVFLNSFHWEDSWPKDAKNSIAVCVNCNDVFAWACADAEICEYKELEDLFNHFEKDSEWGTAVWCIKKRNIMPQEPVYDAIMKSGIWDLNEMGLRENK